MTGARQWWGSSHGLDEIEDCSEACRLTYLEEELPLVFLITFLLLLLSVPLVFGNHLHKEPSQQCGRGWEGEELSSRSHSRMKSVAGMFASPVKLVVENVRKTEEDMKWFVWRARGLEEKHVVMVSLARMDTHVEESTGLPAGWRMKRMLCTNIVCWNMVGCKLSFRWEWVEAFQVVWWGKWMKLWELECLRMIVWWIPRRNSTKVRVVATTGLQGGQEERLEAARGGRGRGGRKHGGGGWAQVPQCQQLWEHMGPIFSLTIASIFSLSNRFCLVSLFWPFMFVFYLLTTLMAW